MTNDLQNNLTCATQTVLENAKIFGANAPEKGELDTRAEIPADKIAENIIETMHAINDLLQNTTGEELTESILWNLINAIHRTSYTINQKDSNITYKLKELQQTNDGSEITDYEMHQLINESTNNYNNSLLVDEIITSLKTEFYKITQNTWQPAKGAVYATNQQTGSTFFAKQLEKDKILTKAQRANIGDMFIVASAPNTTTNEQHKLLNILNGTLKKYPNMSLALFSKSSGADKTVLNWAENQNPKITTIIYEPDFTKGKKAPFVRNDKMLSDNDIYGVITIGNNGIVKNLFDKANNQKIKTYNITDFA